MLPNQHLGHFIIEADITNTATLKPAAEEVSEDLTGPFDYICCRRHRLYRRRGDAAG